MEHSTPNIPASKAVVNLHSSTSIVADARLSSTAVWNALIDTLTWPRWNTLVPRVTIRQQPQQQPSSQHPTSDDSQAGETELSPILQLGTRMTFHVDMAAGESSWKGKKATGNDHPEKPQQLQEVPLVITVFEPPDPATKKPGRIVWAGDSTAPGGFSPWLLRAERTHEICDEEGDSSQDIRRVQVMTWELQTGWLAYVVSWLYGRRLQACFEAWVDNLKGFVENEVIREEVSRSI
ncbi:hypothetical protein VTN77DRAFT_2088 [Rasamsonia byssochlamydoides]|uniref:uncharacterized protein n=1 Tax=Rasamsonia byssochlamydoides TaxID=89139 RepID=UPI003743FAE9